MTRQELNTQYFNWMYALVIKNCRSFNKSYKKLLRYLNDVSFRVLLPMDENRADDGIELRYRFGYEQDYEAILIANLLDDHPCSILELMIALSMRCEEHIMDNPDIGNRIGIWFWEMIVNLGLTGMDDEHFDCDYVRRSVDRFLDRDYERNGKGGLFIVRNTNRDLRSVEIWYQACWYLDEVLEKGE